MKNPKKITLLSTLWVLLRTCLYISRKCFRLAPKAMTTPIDFVFTQRTCKHCLVMSWCFKQNDQLPAKKYTYIGWPFTRSSTIGLLYNNTSRQREMDASDGCRINQQWYTWRYEKGRRQRFAPLRDVTSDIRVHFELKWSSWLLICGSITTNLLIKV